jgi:hypothetical protein
VRSVGLVVPVRPRCAGEEDDLGANADIGLDARRRPEPDGAGLGITERRPDSFGEGTPVHDRLGGAITSTRGACRPDVPLPVTQELDIGSGSCTRQHDGSTRLGHRVDAAAGSAPDMSAARSVQCGHDEDLYVVTSADSITIGPTSGDSTVSWYAAAYADRAAQTH